MIILLSKSIILFGVIFIFLAALGAVRLPDFYSRMHAATKAGAFGVALILFGAILTFGTLKVAIEAVLIIAFYYLTTPVAAHLLGRAAYLSDVPKWHATNPDELAECYEDDDDE